MTIKKISYENKVKTQDDPEKPRKNKVTDEDLNEIKEIVNNNSDELSTAQQNIEDLQAGQSQAAGTFEMLETYLQVEVVKGE